MKDELEKNLFTKFPQLFRQHTWKPEESSMHFGIECFDGWYSLIEEMSEELNALRADDSTDLMYSQIKEKFGLLRVYLDNASDLAYDIVSKYEDLSATVCENCGDKETAKLRTGGWLKVLCDKCNKGRKTRI